PGGAGSERSLSHADRLRGDVRGSRCRPGRRPGRPLLPPGHRGEGPQPALARRARGGREEGHRPLRQAGGVRPLPGQAPGGSEAPGRAEPPRDRRAPRLLAGRASEDRAACHPGRGTPRPRRAARGGRMTRAAWFYAITGTLVFIGFIWAIQVDVMLVVAGQET